MKPRLASPHPAQLVLDSLADGVYVTDLNRRIVVWNRAAERLTGWSPERIVGSSCFDDILAHEDIDGHPLCGEETCPLHRAIATGESSTLPEMVFARTADGRRIPVEVSVAPVHDESGRVIGGVESFRDLTPLLGDLERARLIQDQAMTHGPMNDPRVEIGVLNVPQEYVSGDFCRVELLRPGLVVAMVADVMGHGVSAALHTMQIRSLWEEARALLESPASFLAHLGDKMAALTLGEDFFATCFYGVLDTERRLLRYATAGHPPPRVFREGQMLSLERTGSALGLLQGVSYEERELALAQGDVCLAFTDGAIEAADTSGRELGEAQLCAMFARELNGSLEAALGRLRDEVLAYTGRLRFSDDFTVMAFRIRGGS